MFHGNKKIVAVFLQQLNAFHYHFLLSSAIFSSLVSTSVHFSHSPQSGMFISYFTTKGFFFGTLLIASNAACSLS